MFVDELILKLKLEDICPFTVTLLGGKNAVVEGVKNLIFVDENKVKIRVKKLTVSILGDGLKILEIGDGNLLISGEIKGVEYD